MDPIITGAVVKVGELGEKMADSAAKETGGLLSRLFGPSADVMGQHWADQLREQNLSRLLKKTEKRAKKVEDAGGDPGFANPRVAAQVFESAQYADQEVVAEYLSGVLASSRDDSGANDAGVAWSALVNRLSSDQLRLHFLFYASVRSAAIARGVEHANELHNKEVVLPINILARVSGLGSGERLGDAMDGLMREGLVGDQAGYRWGPMSYVFESELKRRRAEAESEGAGYPYDDGIRFALSIHGMRLFVWGMGGGSAGIGAYVDSAVELVPADSADMPDLIPGFFVDEINVTALRLPSSEADVEGVVALTDDTKVIDGGSP